MRYYVNIICFLLLSIFISNLVSGDTVTLNDISIILLCTLIAFLFHWIAFFPSYIYKTERFFDLVGAITNITVVSFALYYKLVSMDFEIDLRSIVIHSAVSIWAIRLGLFLFCRVLIDGKDRRFDEIKISFTKFLFTWTLSAFWVFITTLAAITSISSNLVVKPDLFLYIGFTLWLFGFTVEIIADFQKRRFKKEVMNENKFISSGLWSISRHPNYLGEIILWIGIFIISIPTLSGFQYISIISPLFVYYLLTNISGINLLEDIADKKWGHLNSYIQYKNKVGVLFPKITKK